MLVDSLHEQVWRISQLQAAIGRHRTPLGAAVAGKAVAKIPGVGLMTDTAVVSSMGSPTAFKDAREFAAWIGLVPRQTGTGGRVQQLGISKRGDA
jgi:transposase